MQEEIDRARVEDGLEGVHGTLFPLDDYSHAPVAPADVCRRIGLNWVAALRLHDKGWLSFNPKEVSALTTAQQAELRFLGILVVAGCDEALLPELLRGLRKPYAYRIELMHYDWQERGWTLLPSDAEQRDRFSYWVERLEESAELDELEEIKHRVERAIRDVRSWGLG
jgi:hypothetical protein